MTLIWWTKVFQILNIPLTHKTTTGPYSDCSYSLLSAHRGRDQQRCFNSWQNQSGIFIKTVIDSSQWFKFWCHPAGCRRWEGDKVTSSLSVRNTVTPLSPACSRLREPICRHRALKRANGAGRAWQCPKITPFPSAQAGHTTLMGLYGASGCNRAALAEWAWMVNALVIISIL